MSELFERRLVVVTGKGGVGRTTTSIAFALAAARAGKRACVIEFDGMSTAARTFGLSERSYAPRSLAPGVDTISLTAQDCLDDFGQRKLKVGRLVRALFRNRVMAAFLEAVPGLSDLLQLGKIENMLTEPRRDDPHYDVLVLDAPATGHGLTMLAAARSMADMTRVGPFHDLARIIERFLSDPEITAIALTTLPEILPVNESLELAEALRDDGAAPAFLMVNQVVRDPLPHDPPWPRVREALGPELAPLVALADEVHARQQQQDRALSRLRTRAPEVLGRAVTIAELPCIEGGDLSPDQVLRLGEILHERLAGAA